MSLLTLNKMYTHFNIDKFISQHVTGRDTSLLTEDFQKNNTKLHAQIDEKSVLVIGGAGTIGSNYIKALLRFRPKRLYVIDINENGLTELVRDLRSSVGYNIPDDFITYPVNFGDKVFEKIFRRFAPFDIVANFAAHKHVRSEKDVFSIEAMINNNVLRARQLLELLAEFPPRHFFCVSTDKATNPVNIMGASKKLMEELIMAYSSVIPITTARFANVAFSNGSLPLGFIERINKRQPLSCPLGIKRFFVSPVESGEICLAASVLGESGDIFFPELDENKDMLDFSKIAIALLNSLGLEADICKTEDEARDKALKLGEKITSYPICFFESDTSGEKSFEEFYTNNEELDLLTFINLGIIKNSPKRNMAEIDNIFKRLESLFCSNTVNKGSVVEILKEYLPNFEHIEKGKHLDQRM
ncbi:MAG: polysaccharide biosynthesis protein [Fusobacteriaceae bacterium]|nr:polysaccharide biosynthesis protein [Fusobacteriaceae bacterium]